MSGRIDSAGQSGSDGNPTCGKIFGESLGTIDPVPGGPAGAHNSHLR